MLLQNYLRSNSDALSELESKYGITAKRHSKYTNLVLLQYNQISSPFSEPIVCEARGPIFDENDNWRLVCHSFNKFFNTSEHLAATIDWSNAKVLPKLDGSICRLYWYDGKWNVATSGSPDASGPVGDFGYTFEQLFWSTFDALEYKPPPSGYEHYTFTFELTGPANRIVVRYMKPSLTLIGVRDIRTNTECGLDTTTLYSSLGWEVIKSIPLSTLEDTLTRVETLDPMAEEGYVVVDSNFNRVKIKSSAYVRLHYLRDHLSRRRLLEIIQRNEGCEFLTYFTEYTEEYYKIKSRYDNLVSELTERYYQIGHSDPVINATSMPECRKQFAAQAVKTRLSSALFSLLDMKVSDMQTYLSTYDSKKLLNILDLEDKDYDRE